MKKIVRTADRYLMTKQLRFRNGGVNIELPRSALNRVLIGLDEEGRKRLLAICQLEIISVGDWEHFTGYEQDIMD